MAADPRGASHPLDLLFVYGTLRRDAPMRAPETMKRGWTLEGLGRVRGELFDLGPYPGARPTDEPGLTIRGELYRLPEPRATLARLDRYEGCAPGDPLPYAFERDRVDVRLDDGRTVEAWVYWYRLTPTGPRIDHGDYAVVE